MPSQLPTLRRSTQTRPWLVPGRFRDNNRQSIEAHVGADPVNPTVGALFWPVPGKLERSNTGAALKACARCAVHTATVSSSKVFNDTDFVIGLAEVDGNIVDGIQIGRTAPVCPRCGEWRGLHAVPALFQSNPEWDIAFVGNPAVVRVVSQTTMQVGCSCGYTAGPEYFVSAVDATVSALGVALIGVRWATKLSAEELEFWNQKFQGR